MPEISQGRIVYPRVPVPDPQGRNTKEGRPFVVISQDETIKAGSDLSLVAITTTIKGEADEVPLPWNRDGKVFTRLKVPSVAKCSWRTPPPIISQDQVDVSEGFVRPVHLREILLKVEELRST